MFVINFFWNQQARMGRVWLRKEFLSKLPLQFKGPLGLILPIVNRVENGFDPFPEATQNLFHFLLRGEIVVTSLGNILRRLVISI